MPDTHYAYMLICIHTHIQNYSAVFALPIVIPAVIFSLFLMTIVVCCNDIGVWPQHKQRL